MPWIRLVLQNFWAFFSAVAVLVSLRLDKPRWVDRFFKLWGRGCLTISGAELRLLGEENLPNDRPYVICANHQSLIDTPLMVAACPRWPLFVAKKEVESMPFAGWVVREMGHIIVDRSNPEEAKRTLAESAAKLTPQQPVLFFPEGTRGPNGDLIPFKKGAFHFALGGGVDIVPVTIRGSRRAFARPVGESRPGPIEVIFHEPIPISEYSEETMQELIDRTYRVIDDGGPADIPTPDPARKKGWALPARG